MLSVKSRRVPGVMTNEELFVASARYSYTIDNERYETKEDYASLLIEEEEKQLENALKMDHLEIGVMGCRRMRHWMLDTAIGAMEGRNAFAGKRNTMWVCYLVPNLMGMLLRQWDLRKLRKRRRVG